MNLVNKKANINKINLKINSLSHLSKKFKFFSFILVFSILLISISNQKEYKSYAACYLPCQVRTGGCIKNCDNYTWAYCTASEAGCDEEQCPTSCGYGGGSVRNGSLIAGGCSCATKSCPATASCNAAPTCTITATTPVLAYSVNSVTATAADTDGTIASYTPWTATGGSLSVTSGKNTTWTAPSIPNLYTLGLTVTDNGGAKGTCSKDITLTRCKVNSDCNDGIACTTDTCVNPGLRTASCTNVLDPCGCVSDPKVKLKIIVKDVTGTTCSSIATAAVKSGVAVTVYNNVNTTLVSATATDAGGSVLTPYISNQSVPYYISASKAGSPTYSLACNETTDVSSIAQVGLTATACNTQTITLGVKKEVKPAWFTVINSDIFAPAIAAAPPGGTGLPIFQSYLIDTAPTLKIGGFIFSKGDIGTTYKYTNNNGGYAKFLENIPDPNKDMIHTDIALKNLTFNPPANATTVTNIIGFTFVAGNVYQISSDVLNSALSSGAVNYTITGTGTAILYVTGSSDLVFANKFNTASTTAKLLIVSKPNVVVANTVGYIVP